MIINMIIKLENWVNSCKFMNSVRLLWFHCFFRRWIFLTWSLISRLHMLKSKCWKFLYLCFWPTQVTVHCYLKLLHGPSIQLCFGDMGYHLAEGGWEIVARYSVAYHHTQPGLWDQGPSIFLASPTISCGGLVWDCCTVQLCWSSPRRSLRLWVGDRSLTVILAYGTTSSTEYPTFLDGCSHM